MIKLHGFTDMLGVKDPSPYVLKVLTYMQMAHIEYVCETGLQSFKKAPRGLFPFIEDGEQIITDSHFIIEYLKKEYVDLDDHLSEVQKAQLVFVQHSLDSFLYECLLYQRWQGENWPKIKAAFFGSLPVPGLLRSLIANKSQKKIVKRLNAHMNKYTEDELLTLADDLFYSLSLGLGNDQYMFNNQPSSADAICYAYLAQFILFEIKSPLSERAEAYQNLVDYCHNINQQFFAGA